MTPSPRERLIETSIRLFYRDGFHATGIDRILAEAGVAKMTLYKHFRSKDELILTALTILDERSRAAFISQVEERGRTARERLLAVFDVAKEWFSDPGYFGCPFINAAAEFLRSNDPIHMACATHNQGMVAYFVELAREVGVGEPEPLGRQWGLLLDGAAVNAHLTGSTEAASMARIAAENLLNLALAAPIPRGAQSKTRAHA